jgi:hypothetical protein
MPSLVSHPRPLVATTTSTSHRQPSLSTHAPSTVQAATAPGPALARYMYPRSRYMPRAPTTAFKSQPAQLDSSLSAQLMDLLGRMQGRSIAKPSDKVGANDTRAPSRYSQPYRCGGDCTCHAALPAIILCTHKHVAPATSYSSVACWAAVMRDNRLDSDTLVHSTTLCCAGVGNCTVQAGASH